MTEQRIPGEEKIGRRRLMKGAGVAVAPLAAETLSARPAFAGVDGDVVLGASNSETNPTAIINTAAATDAFRAFAAPVGTAMFGSSPTGIGVHGKVALGRLVCQVCHCPSESQASVIALAGGGLALLA